MQTMPLDCVDSHLAKRLCHGAEERMQVSHKDVEQKQDCIVAHEADAAQQRVKGGEQDFPERDYGQAGGENALVVRALFEPEAQYGVRNAERDYGYQHVAGLHDEVGHAVTPCP